MVRPAPDLAHDVIHACGKVIARSPLGYCRTDCRQVVVVVAGEARDQDVFALVPVQLVLTWPAKS